MITSIQPTIGHQPWNKGKLVGQKAPLRLRDIWAIRVRLQLHGSTRDLALFNLAIDSKLRASDLVVIAKSTSKGVTPSSKDLAPTHMVVRVAGRGVRCIRIHGMPFSPVNPRLSKSHPRVSSMV